MTVELGAKAPAVGVAAAERLPAESTPTYIPTPRPAVVKPATVTTLPELLHGAVKLKIAALPAVPLKF